MEDGILISFRNEHSQKAKLSIKLTIEGRDNFFLNDLHCLNAWNPIKVMEGGIEISGSELHPKNA